MTYPSSVTLPGGTLLPSSVPSTLPGLQDTPALVYADGLPIGWQSPDGSGLSFSTLTGWFEGADVRTTMTDRVGDHGSFDGRSYRTARVITLAGWVAAAGDERGALIAHLHDLCMIGAEGDLFLFRVNDPDYGDLSSWVRLSGKSPDAAWDGTGQTLLWQIVMTAPDPRKYGPEVPSFTSLPRPGSGGMAFPLFGGTGRMEFGDPGVDGRVTVSNPGTADTWAVYTIVGPVLGGFTLTDIDSGRRLVYAGDVPLGATLVISPGDNGSVLLNGADRRGDLVVKQWTPVKARSSVTVAFSTQGPAGQLGGLTATIRPAYW